jgi:hypothetical protein
MSEDEDQKAPFDTDTGDKSPLGDTDEHSDAQEGAEPGAED